MIANVESWFVHSRPRLFQSNDDLRQEVFVMQLISYFKDIFEEANLTLRLQPYRILSTGATTGLIEVVPNAVSLDGLKKSKHFSTLRKHFEHVYGDAEEKPFRQAMWNYMNSLGRLRSVELSKG